MGINESDLCPEMKDSFDTLIARKEGPMEMLGDDQTPSICSNRTRFQGKS